MARVLHCGEVLVPGCDGVVRAESDDGVMARAAKHRVTHTASWRSTRRRPAR